VTERLSKDDLRVDPLMAQTGHTVDFMKSHSRLIMAAGAIALVVAVGVVLVRASSERAEEKAAGMLAEARSDIAKGALDPAAARLSDLLEFHGGTPSGKMAVLVLADVRFAQGQYAEAEKWYRQAAGTYGKDALTGLAAQRGLAASIESQGRTEDAIAMYQDILKLPLEPLVQADIQMDLARNYLKAGKNEEAERLFQEIADANANPRVAQEAEIRLAEVKALRAG
jgi:tetratricopeptide (TPR) repeat protein